MEHACNLVAHVTCTADAEGEQELLGEVDTCLLVPRMDRIVQNK